MISDIRLQQTMAEPLLTRLEHEKHRRIYRLIQAGKRPRTMETKETNLEFAANTSFLECCRRAGVKPTKRQASKFRNQKGAAYNLGGER